MADFNLGELAAPVENNSLVRPPIILLAVTLGVSIISALSAIFSSGIGYLIAVGASILGGVVTLQDQKRQGHPSYVTLGWFKPSLRILRYLILGITLFHVVILAIAAAKGSGVLF